MMNEPKERMLMPYAFMYHLDKFKALLSRKMAMPKTLLVVLDNCVNQNKSQFVM